MRILSLSLVTAILLSACAPGGGYSRNNQWDYSADTQRSAEQPPSTLSETYQTNTQIPRSDSATTSPTAPLSSINTDNLPTVKVALLAPLSGQHEKLGQAMLNASQLAMFDLGHKNYQIIPKDTRGNANDARQAAKEAIDEGAELIIGPVFAESVRAVKPVASSARVNVLAFSTDWTLGGGNTFIMGFLPFDQIQRLTSYVSTQNINRIGVIAANDNYGRVVSNAYENLSGRYSLQTIASARFNPRSRNLGPDVRAFSKIDMRTEDSPPPYDAILMPVGGQNAITIANLLTPIQTST